MQCHACSWQGICLRSGSCGACCRTGPLWRWCWKTMPRSSQVREPRALVSLHSTERLLSDRTPLALVLEDDAALRPVAGHTLCCLIKLSLSCSPAVVKQTAPAVALVIMMLAAKACTCPELQPPAMSSIVSWIVVTSAVAPNGLYCLCSQRLPATECGLLRVCRLPPGQACTTLDPLIHPIPHQQHWVQASGRGCTLRCWRCQRTGTCCTSTAATLR